MELHQTTHGDSRGQQTTQPSAFTPPKPPTNGRRLTAACRSLCSLENKISLFIFGREKKKSAESLDFFLPAIAL